MSGVTARRTRGLLGLFGMVLASSGLEGCLLGCPSGKGSADVHPLVRELDQASLAEACAVTCGTRGCAQGKTENGTPAITCADAMETSCVSGRRPRGLRPVTTGAATRGAGPVAAILTSRARLEAASVLAFEDLARELSGWGAPARLVARAEKAARDEVRHARVVSSLAVMRGGRATTRVARRARAARGLLPFALENAREGCVFETFAALTALVESRTATDPAIRRHMPAIARDEAAHAELAHDVDAWVRSRLTAAQRARLDRAHQAAWSKLSAMQAGPSLPSLGIGCGASRRALAAALASALSP